MERRGEKKYYKGGKKMKRFNRWFWNEGIDWLILAILCLSILGMAVGCKKKLPTSPDIDGRLFTATCLASVTEGETPLWVTFIGSVDGGVSPYTYHWDFGNGDSSDLQNPPAEEYSFFGTYTIIFTVTDSATVQVSDSITIKTYSKHWIKIGVSAATDYRKTWHAKLFLNGENFTYWGDPVPFGGNSNYSNTYYNNNQQLYAGEYEVTVMFWSWDPFEPDPPENAYFKIKVEAKNPNQEHNLTIDPEFQEIGSIQWKAGEVREFIIRIIEN